MSSVQRLMDELASAKEMERDVLQTRLDELQSEHEALKNKDYSVRFIYASQHFIHF